MAESLSDRLRSLGIRPGVPKTQPKEPTYHKVEGILGLEAINNPYGLTYVAKQYYPLSYQHGVMDIGRSTNANPKILLQWAQIPTPLTIDKFLFVDTETTGLTGGTGTFAFLVGLGWWSNNGFELQQLFLQEPGNEAAFLSSLGDFLQRFEVIVTFNGKSFDAPLLNTRYVMNSMQSPIGKKYHIDILHLSRRIWRNRLSDRSLGSLEEQILRISRTSEEIPGWMIPDIYADYLRTGNPMSLKGVFYHNATDILSLAALYAYLANMLSNPFQTNSHVLEMLAIAHLYEELGYIPEAITLYEQCLSTGIPNEFLEQTLLRLATVYKRIHRWREALVLWERAAHGLDSSPACIELAKYYEHYLHDNATALQWVEKAEQLLPPGYIDKTHKELAHRMARLRC